AGRLASRGYALILVARRRDRLEALADRVSRETGRKVELIVADLSETDGVVAVERLLRENPAITLLVNNAGMARTSPFLDLDPEVADQMIRLNVTAPTRLAQAAGRSFSDRGAGTIINIASVTALLP